MIDMKKALSILLAVFIALFAFAACEKETEDEKITKKNKRTTTTIGKEEVSDVGGLLITNFAEEIIPVVSKENGEVLRDENGNVIVLVTDADGKVVKNDNGELVTKAEAVGSAIVVGNRIEMPDFAINIPDGWSNEASYNILNIKKDSTDTIITIMTNSVEDETTLKKAHENLVVSCATGEVVKKTEKVAGCDADIVYTYTTLNGSSVFVGYIDFVYQGKFYSTMVSSTGDISSSWNEIVSIVNTIEFIN